jgi:hypothetical protein
MEFVTAMILKRRVISCYATGEGLKSFRPNKRGQADVTK